MFITRPGFGIQRCWEQQAGGGYLSSSVAFLGNLYNYCTFTLIQQQVAAKPAERWSNRRSGEQVKHSLSTSHFYTTNCFLSSSLHGSNSGLLPSTSLGPKAALSTPTLRMHTMGNFHRTNSG